MKIAFLIHSLEVNSCRYRVLQYVPFLKEQGVEVSIHFYQRTWQSKMKLYRTLKQYDILYIHRKLFSPLEFWYLRREAKRIVYDIDDALMYRSSGRGDATSSSRRMKFAFMMKRVDFIVAGNQFLKSEVLSYNPHVTVLPTSLDLSRYSCKEYHDQVDPMTIGWLGSGSTLKYLRNLMPTLEGLFEKCPHFQLKIVCDQFLDSSKVPVIKKKWSSEEEEKDLKSFDIGVMPLSDDLWSQGKCGLKILQYFGVGIPVVCTPVGINRDIVEDGISGFWASDGKQWEDRLSRLMQEKSLRRQMGMKGRRTVEEGYCLDVNAPRLHNLLQYVLHGEDRRP
jgi:glycosyltransferase involved in cell wall biosynthesis